MQFNYLFQNFREDKRTKKSLYLQQLEKSALGVRKADERMNIAGSLVDSQLDEKLLELGNYTITMLGDHNFFLIALIAGKLLTL